MSNSRRTGKSKRSSEQQPDQHEFAALGEFDRAMRKIVATPKETVLKREKAEKRRKA